MVGTPRRRQVRMTRHAISPRLAIKTPLGNKEDDGDDCLVVDDDDDDDERKRAPRGRQSAVLLLDDTSSGRAVTTTRRNIVVQLETKPASGWIFARMYRYGKVSTTTMVVLVVFDLRICSWKRQNANFAPFVSLVLF